MTETPLAEAQPSEEPDTRTRLLEAARMCLLDQGFARLSTRRVAEEAGIPLSQIHHHFRSKQGLVLALLAQEDDKLIGRQRRMYGQDEPLGGMAGLRLVERVAPHVEDPDQLIT